MATVTRQEGIFPFGDGTVATLEVDYDDVLLTPTAVRCINGAPSSFTAVATSTIGNHIGQTASRTFPANQTTTVNLPSGAVNRWGVTVDPDHGGRVDGIELSTRWGA